MSTSKPCWNPEKMNADKERKPAFSPLFTSIAFWVLLAILLAALVAAVLLKLLGWSFSFSAQGGAAGDNAPDLYKFIQSVLTIVAGIGAVAYLVIKYRERSDAEDSKAEKRLNDAINQLGDESPQVRIAGVYALADIADTFQGPYKQRVVDILCGYLRTDRSDGGVQQSDTSSPVRFRDAAVESTVLSVIASHVRKDADSAKSWSECDFDLHGALLHEDIPFTGTLWRGVFNIKGIEFLGKAEFSGASFGDRAFFTAVSFNGGALFIVASFGDGVDFSGASFGDGAFFTQATFGDGADFHGVPFGDGANFSEASFGHRAFFTKASFGKETNFSGASFGDGGYFLETRYGHGSRLTQVQEEWLQCEGVEGPLEDQLEGDAAQEPSNESGADNAQRDDADPAAEETPGESGAADEKSTDNN